MLKSLTIESFRCFKNLQVDRLERVNLIVGGNNSGKTAFLEGIFLLLGWFPARNQGEFPHLFRTAPRSGDRTEDFWKWLFYNKNVSQPVVLNGNDSVLGQIKMVICGAERMPSDFGAVTKWRTQMYQFWFGSSMPNPNQSPPILTFSIHTQSPEENAQAYDRLLLRA
ncbi:MAG: AAA family ATPase, partial [Planctomycetota bacterium]